MIRGLTFEYAHARISASLSHRPGERLWQQLRAARGVDALLDLVRSSPAASWVSGIAASGDGDAIELALRQRARGRIDEVASWVPEPWQAAVLHTHELIALPALLHLLTAEPPPLWIASDPGLGRYALADRAQRRSAIDAGSLAALADAVENETAVPAQPAAGRGRDAPHPALRAWLRAWQARWPECSREVAAELLRVAHTVGLHISRFGSLKPEDAAAARQSLSTTLVTFVHRFAAQPAELFAYLALFALDLERIRWEFLRCARPVQATE